MQRASLDDLTAAGPYDVLILGGGIYGLMACREAALRGLRVALVDRGDFGAETSHNSLKIMHGGIRYVQHLDFRRLRASVRERSFWQSAAPDLVRPMDFVIPLFGHGLRGPEVFGAAAALYGLAASGLKHPAYRGAGVISAGAAQERLGDLAPAGLTGGGIWKDGQIQDVNRLHMAVLRSGVEAGALAANHMEALSLLRDGTRVTGARLRDHVTGADAEIRAQVVVLCAGAATAKLAAPVIPDSAQRFPGFARATNLVVDHPPAAFGQGIVSRSQSDAVVNRGGRMFFLTPWQDRTIIGTFETPATPDQPRAVGDLTPFLQDIALAAPKLQLTRDKVLWMHQGLIPAESDDGPNAVQRMTRGTLVDHAAADGVGGLISTVGVKYTTARLIAERTIERACQQIPRTVPPAHSHRVPLPAAAPMTVDVTCDQSLERRIRDAFDREMAITLTDVVLRRSTLAERGALRTPGLLDRVLRLSANLQNWGADQIQTERHRLQRAVSAATPT